MTRRATALEQKRARLIARSAELRAELERDGRELALRFGVADRVLGIVRSGPVRAVLFGGAALILFWHPRRLIRLASRGLLFWPVIRPFLPSLVRLWRDPPTPVP